MRGHSLDTYLQLIADGRRRRVIRELRREADGELTIDELVERLRSDESSSRDRRTDREQLAVQLYHTSLPKLADHGVVEYDRGSETVRYRPNELVETVLDSLSEEKPVVNS